MLQYDLMVGQGGHLKQHDIYRKSLYMYVHEIQGRYTSQVGYIKVGYMDYKQSGLSQYYRVVFEYSPNDKVEMSWRDTLDSALAAAWKHFSTYMRSVFFHRLGVDNKNARLTLLPMPY